MANRTFALNTTPHVADIGGTELLFLPEAMGDDFMDAYEGLREAQKTATGLDVDDLSGASADQLRSVTRALREFLARLMVEDSALFFSRVYVVRGSEVLESFTDRAAAEEFAAGVPGARAVWAFPLPDRVLVELMEWVVELYGGAGGKRPPTSSGASAPASRTAGRRGTAPSRSKG